MNEQIFWIASFPKSGNTLVRSLLASLFFTDDGIVDLKLLSNIPYLEDTSNLEFIKKINDKDYHNLHNPNILSNYWEKMQSKQNLNLKEDFIFNVKPRRSHQESTPIMTALGIGRRIKGSSSNL